MVGKSEREKIQDFYIQYEKLFLGYAAGLVKDQAMAEDAVHDTFVTLLQKGERICAGGTEQMLRWCIVVLKNRCVDQLRRQKRYSGMPVEQLFLFLRETEISPEEKLEEKETKREMKEILQCLDPLSLQILEMKYCLEMSYGEIAKELGLSRKFVDNRIMLSKKKLRATRGKAERKGGAPGEKKK